MLAPWLELPGAAERLAAWSEISGLDLARLGTTATAEEITDTAVTQPLVVAATLLAHEELTKRGLLVGADLLVAGHSVGEIAAYAIAGVISADDAVSLAATRGVRDGQGVRRRADRHVRGARRRRGRGARPASRRSTWSPPTATPRDRSSPRVHCRRWTSSPRTRRPRPGFANWPPPGRSTPTTWPPRSTDTPPQPTASPPASRPPRCCPTPTASPSHRLPTR